MRSRKSSPRTAAICRKICEAAEALGTPQTYLSQAAISGFEGIETAIIGDAERG
jgi:hypothetical protein